MQFTINEKCQYKFSKKQVDAAVAAINQLLLGNKETLAVDVQITGKEILKETNT